VPLLFSLVVDAKLALFRAMGWSTEEMGQVQDAATASEPIQVAN
jgi:hypothetical protein